MWRLRACDAYRIWSAAQRSLWPNVGTLAKCSSPTHFAVSLRWQDEQASRIRIALIGCYSSETGSGISGGWLTLVRHPRHTAQKSGPSAFDL